MSGASGSRDPTRRFSDRVEHYARHRPGYPDDLLPFLVRALGLEPAWVVADVGSGTGLLARAFLVQGNTVFCVEPDAAMRRAAERALADRPGFRSVAGAAEATTLPAASMDLVVAGQAFHWFRAQQARAEFVRILRPPHRVVLVWNQRGVDRTPFLRAYEELLRRFGTDYREVDHRRVSRPEAMTAFFGEGRWERASFASAQILDWEGLTGRALSSSYVPGPDHAEHAPMIECLQEIFRAHASDGTVTIEYETAVFHGRLEG